MSLRTEVKWHEAFLPPLELPLRFSAPESRALPEGPIKECTLRYLREFWDATDRGVAPLFTGRTRAWKTYAASLVATWVHGALVPTRFIEAGPYFTRVDMAFYGEGQALLKSIEEIPFLVLDDFPQVRPGTRAAELMANVVAVRFAAKRPTLVTGNVELPTVAALAALAVDYRPDFARRLWDGSDGYRVHVG